jgi:hypothetical protein
LILPRTISSQLTPRARFGMVALLAIGLFLIVSSILEDADSRARIVRQMREELETLTGSARDVDWAARARDAEEAKKAWRSVKWQGETSGIAATEIQAFLAKSAGPSGIRSPRVQVSSDTIDLFSQPALRFEVTGSADSRSFLSLVGAIVASPKTLRITEMTAVMSGEQGGRIQLSGYAPFLLAPPAEAAASSATGPAP